MRGESVCVSMKGCREQCGENGPARTPLLGLNSISSPTGVLFTIPEMNHTGSKEELSGRRAPCMTHEGLGGLMSGSAMDHTAHVTPAPFTSASGLQMGAELCCWSLK